MTNEPKTDDDGWGVTDTGLIYTLQHIGYRRGVPTYCNRFSIRVDADQSVSDDEKNELIAYVLAALRSRDDVR